MSSISVYRIHGNSANIDQLPMKRDWMDLTFDRHAYQCFPVSLANRLGWTISYPEDISFIWDGINDSTPDHIKILSGEKYVHPNRGNRALSFNTGLYFESNKNVSLLTMPVPNQFIDGAQCMTTVISTSVLDSDLPIAWMVTRPNVEITIPANTPIAAILPISLKNVQDHKLVVKNGSPKRWSEQSWREHMHNRSLASQAKNSVGDWTHFYRDAVDHLGQPFGEHEAKKIVMEIEHEKEN